MKCTQCIESTLSIFEAKPSTYSRYENEKNWLHIRKAKWSSNKIRIGVIGVTSSGKSTLINAILGDSLLSMAVKPSSSQLVSCSKGNHSKAIISFKNSKDLVLEGEQLSPENIKKYSDENVNKGNKENVTDIQLIAANFDLGEDVLLIDSAGLDAYKLESHEKLSLEVLLPTIDMCIFVTTLKTNSDEKTRMVLNTIAKHNCPLLIVQNMLDSVEPSADGKKTKEMVASEHKKRLQRIVDASSIKDKASVQIIQVSAVYAMKARCYGVKEEQESHYHEFIDIMLGMIKEFIPRIDEERCLTFINRYRQLIIDEEAQISGKIVEKPHFRYEGLKNKLVRKLESVNQALQRELDKLVSTDQQNEEANKNRKWFLGMFELKPKDELTSDNVDQRINALKAKVKDCEESILRIITDFNNELASIAKIIDIPLRDLVSFTQLETISTPQKIVEDVKKTRREKKSGIGSWFARGFGALTGNDDWGYEEIPYTVKELNKTRTLEELDKYIQRAHRVYQKSAGDWMKSIMGPMSNIEVEIDRSYASFLERQKQIDEIEDVAWIIGELDKIIKLYDKVERPVSSYHKKSFGTKEELASLTEYQLTGYQIGLLELSRKVINLIANQSLIHGMKSVKAPERVVVMGWDCDCIINFLIRFFNIALPVNIMNELRGQGIINYGDVCCIHCPEISHLNQLLHTEPTSIFILVNAQQDGSAKNQINSLKLKENTRVQDRIFFVVEDFDSLINSEGVREMISNLQEYYDEFEVADRRGMLLINDDNPMYNLAFMQIQSEPCRNITEEQDLLKQLKDRFHYLFDSTVSEVVADLIRHEGKDFGYEKL